MPVVPTLLPLITGCVPGAVCPAGIKTLAGTMVAMVGSTIEKFTVVPPSGAADESETLKAALCPTPTVGVAGRLIEPSVATVTAAVVSARIELLAWITAWPLIKECTGTWTLVAFVGKLTVLGTVATVGVSELRLTVTPAGAGAESVSVRLPSPPVPIVSWFGLKASVAVT